jgi:hypothetical protein
MQQFLQFITLTFMYGSTCFVRPHAHQQELNNCSSSPWFYRWSVVVAMLLVVVGPAGPTTTNSTATTITLPGRVLRSASVSVIFESSVFSRYIKNAIRPEPHVRVNS